MSTAIARELDRPAKKGEATPPVADKGSLVEMEILCSLPVEPSFALKPDLAADFFAKVRDGNVARQRLESALDKLRTRFPGAIISKRRFDRDYALGIGVSIAPDHRETVRQAAEKYWSVAHPGE